MRARSLLAALLFVTAASGSACSQTPIVVPLRSMERPRDVDFICLKDTGNGTWTGTTLENCAANFDNTAKVAGSFRLHAVISQVSRGELAVVDLGRVPTDPAVLTKADPRLPGYSFIPVGAVPTDVVADPNGDAVYVSSGRDPRIDVLPSALLRGPIDTLAAASDSPPWPHLDFDRASEGMPSAMSIVRSGATRRLYVTLPDAKPAGKIAVFDLVSSAILPARIGDIALAAPAPAPLVVKTAGCGPTGASQPWWAKYDTCGSETTKIPGGSVTPDATTDFHLAGVHVAGDKLFVADDRASVIHVYDVKGGAGIEIRRIAVGANTSRLAVSPVVPDEVTIHNSAAIDVCVARGWLGDGLDHSAENTLVRDQLGGRCRAHRYLYAIDLVNDQSANGSIAIVDLPVTFALDDKNQIKLTEEGVPLDERIDIDGAELVQPMACDAPSFPTRRLPLGPFGLGGLNTVPARAVAFVSMDPPNVAGQTTKAVRCRPFDTVDPSDATKRSDAHPLVPNREFEGVSDDERNARKSIGKAWAVGVGPRRMRGVFAWVALANGALAVIDVDDYDSLCRGPVAESRRGLLFRHPDETPISLGGDATNEYFPGVVRRHHPRSLRAFDDNLVPAVSGVVFSQFDGVISNDPANEQGRTFPHFAALAAVTGDATRPPLVLPAPDNPYSLSTETWTVTFEGSLPGFTGAFGELNTDGGALALKDPSAGFCRRGVESDGAVETHDAIQLVDEICRFDSCTKPGLLKSCTDLFGDTAQKPLKLGRTLLIEKAFDDRVTIANKHFAVRNVNGVERFERVDGPPDLALIKECFGAGLLRYTVRSSGSWIVVGSSTGFLHRKLVDPTATDKVCINDASRPRIHNGRAGELPPLSADALRSLSPLGDAPNLVSDDCFRFINPSWKFAIRKGTADSRQDMRFTFAGRFSWQPFSLAVGQLPTSMRAVAAYWDGRERLNWNMIAAVDAVERGLIMFPASAPFAYQKGAN